ncbi:RNA ligase family protein [Kineosporia sp. NBRC 101677]|uniref:RNA ligase family protein n=1 Tax=Kineosporia sp. NBRC 101677 TaxID=3032197 RepID=UPI0025541C75|nr:RNA ligase family protein [Kineosporia sp. NBRC 101677]
MTEKMDGENITIGKGYVHARSVDSPSHPSRTWVRALAGRLWPELPAGMRVCGENLYARHSIVYDELPSFFLVFNIWQDDVCLDWDSTLEWVQLLGLTCVPVLYRGRFPDGDERDLLRLWQKQHDTRRSEGFVVRTAGSFERAQFGSHVAKWVRAGHVQTGQHWMSAAVTPNSLARKLHDTCPATNGQSYRPLLGQLKRPPEPGPAPRSSRQ